MAGKPVQRQELADARVRIGELESERDALRRLLAVHAPGVSIGDQVQAPERYDEGVKLRIIAMGKAGMSEPEWIAELGLSRIVWEEWKLQSVDMMDACHVAHAQMLAYWNNAARTAVATNNNRFPMTLYREFTSQQIGGGSDKGDASKLVLLDLAGSIIEITDQSGKVHRRSLKGRTPRHAVTLK